MSLIYKPRPQFVKIKASYDSLEDYLAKRANMLTENTPYWHQYDYADDNEEGSKYLKEKNDPKWDEVLIDGEEGKWSRREIRNHYVKNADKILKEIKGKPVLIYILTDKNKTILKRKHDDKPIIFNNKEDLEYWADRRLGSIHYIIGSKTKLGWLDLDVHGSFPTDKVKKYAHEIAGQIKSKYHTTPKIWDSGGSGYHIEFELGSEKDTDALRDELRVLCDELNEKYEGFTSGLVKGSGVRTDTTTLKDTGSLRAGYTLHESKGGVKEPLGSGKTAALSKNSFQEKIPGGLAAGKDPADFDQKALMDGIHIELEHTDDILLAMEIATDHLTEDPDYYIKLKKIEQFNSPLSKLAARVEAPKKMLKEIYNWAAGVFADIEYEKRIDKMRLANIFPVDLSDVKVLDEHRKIVNTREATTNLTVTIILNTLYKDSGSGAFRKDQRNPEIKLFFALNPDWTAKNRYDLLNVIRHELTHLVQSILTDVIALEKPKSNIPPWGAGLPHTYNKRKLLRYDQPGGWERSDVEFYPMLSTLIDDMREKLFKPLNIVEKSWIEVNVGMEIPTGSWADLKWNAPQVCVVIMRNRFEDWVGGNPWLNNLKKSPSSYKKIISELYKEFDSVDLSSKKVASSEIFLSKRATHAPFKKCSCGKTYATLEDFLALPFKRQFHTGSLLEDPGLQCWNKEGFGDLVYRDCECKSTMTIKIPCPHVKTVLASEHFTKQDLERIYELEYKLNHFAGRELLSRQAARLVNIWEGELQELLEKGINALRKASGVWLERYNSQFKEELPDLVEMYRDLPQYAETSEQALADLLTQQHYKKPIVIRISNIHSELARAGNQSLKQNSSLFNRALSVEHHTGVLADLIEGKTEESYIDKDVMSALTAGNYEPRWESEVSKIAKDPLAAYKKKRDFGKTNEPEGEVVKENKHRFVIQKHEADKAGSHYDLRLENDSGVMSSWALPKHKMPGEGERLLAVKTEDHPVSYNAFGKNKAETIEAGEYGSGIIKVYDSGTYEEIKWTGSTIKFRLNGKKEKGLYTLHKTNGKNWLLMEMKNE